MTYEIGNTLINDNGHTLQLITFWDDDGEDFKIPVYICREPKTGNMRALSAEQLKEKGYRKMYPMGVGIGKREEPSCDCASENEWKVFCKDCVGETIEQLVEKGSHQINPHTNKPKDWTKEEIMKKFNDLIKSLTNVDF